jgi:hypothetical protein
MLNRTKYLLLGAAMFAVCFVVSERPALVPIDGFMSVAHAVVGRPLTPVSVAGVARRTVRRCAVGVYNC